MTEVRRLLDEGYEHANSSDESRALALFERALELIEREPDSHLKADVLIAVGVALQRRNDFERALEFFERTLSVAQATAYASAEAFGWYNVGLVCHRLGRHRRAIAALERALDGGLDTGAERLMLGALHLRLDDADAARPHLEAAVFRWPGSELAWRLRFQSAPAGERPALEPRAAQWLGPAAAAELADWVWGGAG